MAIKVKHEGSTASRLAAAAQGGAAKRAMEAAALAKPSQIQTLQAAHASAPGISTPHAQLIGAPGGGAHAGLIGGGGGIGARLGGGRRSTPGTDTGSGSRRVVRGSGDALDGDYKVTGTSIFNRPDDDSVWREDLRQWIRPWLPGEKEAEATRRVGEVKNELAEQMYDYKLTQSQRQELESINNALEDARKSGRYTPDEMAELERQADARRLGIKPMPLPKSELPTPNVQMIGNRKFVQNGNRWDPVEEAQTPEEAFAQTKVDEATGKRFGLDRSGKLYEVGAERDDFAQLMKLVPDTRTEMQTDPVTKKPVEVQVPLSWDERMEYMRQLKEMRDEFSTKPPPAAPAMPAEADPVLAARMANSIAAPSISDVLAPGQQPVAPEDNGDAPLVLFGDEPDYGGTNLEDDYSRGLPPDRSKKDAAKEEEDEFAKFRRK